MIRAVLDTNLLIDIELRRIERYAPIKRAAISHKFVALTSLSIIQELERALERDSRLIELRQNRSVTINDLKREVLSYTQFAGGFDFFRRVLREDPGDQHVVASALAGNAQYIVTNNRADFSNVGRLSQNRIKVISPEEFMDILESKFGGKKKGLRSEGNPAL